MKKAWERHCWELAGEEQQMDSRWILEEILSQQDIAVEWIWRVKEKEDIRVGPKSIKTTIWVAVFVTWGYLNKIPQAGWA